MDTPIQERPNRHLRRMTPGGYDGRSELALPVSARRRSGRRSGGGGGAAGAGATVSVAAYNSTDAEKAAADFLCTGTNDDVVIQLAIEYLVEISEIDNVGLPLSEQSVGLGRLLLLSGDFFLSAPVELPQVNPSAFVDDNAFSICGLGMFITWVYADDDFAGGLALFKFPDVAAYEDEAWAINGIRFADLALWGSYVYSGIGIDVGRLEHCTIERVNFPACDSGAFRIRSNDIWGLFVHDCLAEETAFAAVGPTIELVEATAGGDLTNVIISRNHFYGTGYLQIETAECAEPYVDEIVITDNWFFAGIYLQLRGTSGTHQDAYDIVVAGNTFQQGPSMIYGGEDVVFEGNTLLDSNLICEGIRMLSLVGNFIDDGSGYVVLLSEIIGGIVSGNALERAGSGDDVLSMHDCSGVLVTGNVLDCLGVSSPNRGMVLDGCDGCDVNGNVFYGITSGSGTAAVDPAVAVVASTACRINNNRFFTSSTTRRWTYLVTVDASSVDTVVTMNFGLTDAYATGILSDAGTGTVTTSGNRM